MTDPTANWHDRVHPVVPWLVATVVLCGLPWLTRTAYDQYLINVIGINIVLAVGLNIVKGFAGQVTVGHIALMAIGGYASAVISVNFGVPFWGALPLAIGFGDGAELRQPLGISIIGGLIVSQVLTLYTTPVIYLYLDRFRRRDRDPHSRLARHLGGFEARA